MEVKKLYLASEDIARRARCIDSSYRTKDGRFIISEKSLRDFSFRMTPEEYVTGLDVEMITEEEAQRLIAEGGYAIGPAPVEVESPATPSDSPEEPVSPEAEAPEESDEDSGDDSGEQDAGDVEDKEETDVNEEEE